MSIVVNKNTAQNPITSGLTGAQSVKVIPAPRVYVRAPDSTSAAIVPSVKSNGATPTGTPVWNDLGVVEDTAAVKYVKKVKQVTTGIDDVLRAAYAQSKTGEIDFTLSQVDDAVVNLVSGLAASQITSGSAYTFHLGQEDLTQVALLLVSQNKLDGKEWQFYSPLAYLSFDWQDNKGEMQLKCTGLLPFFTVQGQTEEDILAASIFA